MKIHVYIFEKISGIRSDTQIYNSGLDYGEHVPRIPSSLFQPRGCNAPSNPTTHLTAARLSLRESSKFHDKNLFVKIEMLGKNKNKTEILAMNQKLWLK